MTGRDDALAEVVALVQRHGLTLDEISAGLAATPDNRAKKAEGLLSRLFSYIGGLFVFAGLAIFIAMQWEIMSPLGHVLVTLGSGLCLFVMALACTTRDNLHKAATPLFLAAAFLQAFGLVVLLNEFYPNIDELVGFLAIHVVLAVQQGFTFYDRRRGVLALTSLYFIFGSFAIGLDLLGVPGHLNGAVIGLSLLSVGWSLDRSRYHGLSPLVYFCGASLFLITAYDWLNNSSWEILFLGLTCAIIFLSTVARSRMLLFVGTVALLGYLGDFMYSHFGNSLIGPIGLILAGFLLIGVGWLAVRINKLFISGSSQGEQR